MNRGTVVLVVEDMEEARELARTVLARSGFLVLTAPDAEAALRVMRIVIIDVLFTDIVLPGGMNGYQLARLAHSINPLIKVICTTGFQWALETSWDVCRVMLSKPYLPEQLIAEVERAVAL